MIFIIRILNILVVPDLIRSNMTKKGLSLARHSGLDPESIVPKYLREDFISISNLDYQCPFVKFSGTFQWIPDRVRDDDC
jgi:hypothetical protein